MSDRIFESLGDFILEEKRVVKKIFIGKKVSGVPIIDILTSNHERFLSHANLSLRLNIELDLELADAVLIPHDLYYVRNNAQYRNYIRDLAKKCPVIVFSIGDYPTFVGSKNIIYLQTHFTSRIRKINVIQFPYNAEILSDVGVGHSVNSPVYIWCPRGACTLPPRIVRHFFLIPGAVGWCMRYLPTLSEPHGEQGLK